ncbi:MAG: hypothetical protein RJA34_2905 [Pseudomonadota bacterium]|jgi:hypothetical protein
MKLSQVAAAAAIVSQLAACGGDDVVNGVFLDSAVQGVAYKTSGGQTGTTDARGGYTCYAGQTMTFSIGAAVLGTVACDEAATPLELAGTTDINAVSVVNRLVFLQSLDKDDDASNGIEISSDVAKAMKSLDFSKKDTDFTVEMTAALPLDLKDKFGKSYEGRDVSSKRRDSAKEHFSGTLAGLGRNEAAREVTDTVAGKVAITSFTLKAADSLFVPYPGSNADIAQDFPKGFYPAAGSGLAYKGKDADGNLLFLGITDRGANGDGPKGTWSDGANSYSASKVFPAPAFAPSIGLITVGKDGAVLKSLSPLMATPSTKVTGLPLSTGAVGATGEIALTDTMTAFNPVTAGFDANGLDTESLVIDKVRNVLWTSDEYGPFIVKLDPTSYEVKAKYGPGTGLPAVLAKRRPNRGMEGLALDDAGKLHGFLQSPIDAGKATDASDMDGDSDSTDKVNLKDYAQFARWVEFDPDSVTTKTYAYPLTYAYAATGGKWDRNRTGSAKLGDMASLGQGKFLVIEQGSGTNADGTSALSVHNYLMLVEVPADVTDISADDQKLEANSIDGSTVSVHAWSSVKTLKKTLLMDLNAAGWVAEKAEGLTLVDANTIALINDNDFGVRTQLFDVNGKAVDGSIEDCTVNALGQITDAGNGTCAAGAVTARLTRGADAERPTRLWFIKFPKALSSYTIAN